MLCGNTDAAGINLYGLFFLEPPMTMRKTTLFVFLIFALAAPLSAQSRWTEEFLLHLNPAEHRFDSGSASDSGRCRGLPDRHHPDRNSGRDQHDAG